MSSPNKTDKKAFFAGLHGVITGMAALATASVAIIGLSINQGWIGGTKTGGGTSVTTVASAAPQFAVDPTSLVLQPLGATTESVDVSNIGFRPMTVEPPTLTGPNASHFVAADQTCGASVTPGSSCQLQVTFKQGGPGTFNAVLVVRVTGAASVAQVPITATAIL